MSIGKTHKHIVCITR